MSLCEEAIRADAGIAGEGEGAALSSCGLEKTALRTDRELALNLAHRYEDGTFTERRWAWQQLQAGIARATERVRRLEYYRGVGLGGLSSGPTWTGGTDDQERPHILRAIEAASRLVGPGEYPGGTLSLDPSDPADHPLAGSLPTSPTPISEPDLYLELTAHVILPATHEFYEEARAGVCGRTFGGPIRVVVLKSGVQQYMSMARQLATELYTPAYERAFKAGEIETVRYVTPVQREYRDLVAREKSGLDEGELARLRRLRKQKVPKRGCGCTVTHVPTGHRVRKERLLSWDRNRESAELEVAEWLEARSG